MFVFGILTLGVLASLVFPEPIEEADSSLNRPCPERDGPTDQEVTMGYVERALSANDQVIARGTTHWWIFARGTGLTVVGLYLLTQPSEGMLAMGGILVAVGVVMLVRAYLAVLGTELAVTNKRVIAKFGLIRRHTIELNHGKVEGFHVNQGIIGRFLNFGTLTVSGTGGLQTPIPLITDPLGFRAKAMQQIELAQQRP
jgi:hypothetical protein